MNEVKAYLSEIGRKGGKAGRGKSKARTHEQAVAAGRMGGKASARRRRKRKAAAAGRGNR